jgi:hypothetical protein
MNKIRVCLATFLLITCNTCFSQLLNLELPSLELPRLGVNNSQPPTNNYQNYPQPTSLNQTQPMTIITPSGQTINGTTWTTQQPGTINGGTFFMPSK